MGSKRSLALMFCVALLLGLAAPLGAATIFQWEDEHGTVHFGEQPPPGVEATAVTVVPAPAPAPAQQAAAPGQGAPPLVEEEDEPLSIAEQARRERAERRAEARERRQEVERQCQLMREQLDWAEPRPRVLVQMPDGSTRRLEDEERMALVNEAKAYLAENCD